MAPVLKTGYWNIRGLMQPIRLLLEYLETPYDEKLYDCKQTADGYDRSMWLDEKEKLDLDFPNLPYMIDAENDVKVTEASASE